MNWLLSMHIDACIPVINYYILCILIPEYLHYLYLSKNCKKRGVIRLLAFQACLAKG